MFSNNPAPLPLPVNKPATVIKPGSYFFKDCHSLSQAGFAPYAAAETSASNPPFSLPPCWEQEAGFTAGRGV